MRDLVSIWKELSNARKTLSSISAQDEFAKWARQQRKIDKLQADYEKLDNHRQRLLFAKSLGLSIFLRILSYVILFWILQIKFSKVGLLCNMADLLGPLAKLTSFPHAPAGILFAILRFIDNSLWFRLFKRAHFVLNYICGTQSFKKVVFFIILCNKP